MHSYEYETTCGQCTCEQTRECVGCSRDAKSSPKGKEKPEWEMEQESDEECQGGDYERLSF